MTVLSPTFIPVPGVTLDGAYDFGGAGVGRTITVDAGAVHLDNRQTAGEIQRIDVGAPIVLTAALSGLVIDIFTNVTTAGFQASAILMPWNGTAGFNTTITRSHLSLGAAPIISIVKEGAGLSLVMNGAGVDHLRLRLKRTDSFVTPNSVAFFVVEGTNLGGVGFEASGIDFVATSLVAGAEDIEMRLRTRTAGVSSERLLIVPTGIQFKNTASVVTAVILAAGRLILGGTAPVGAEFLRVVGDARVEGKLTVTGVLDPTQVLLSGADKKYGATDAGPVYLAPFADAITGVQVRKADSVTVILNVDTTNSRIGIGTSAPATQLHLTGTIRKNGTSGGVALEFFNTTSGIVEWDILESGASLRLRSVDRLEFSNFVGGVDFSVDATGVVTAGNSIQVPDGTAALPRHTFTSDNTLGMFKSGSDLGFATSGVDRGRFTSAGVFLINATAAFGTEKFRVVGDARVEGNLTVTGLYNFVSRATDPAGVVGIWQEYVFDNGVTRELRIVGPTGTVNTVATLVP